MDGTHKVHDSEKKWCYYYKVYYCSMILISAFLKIPWVLLYSKMHFACPWSLMSMAKRWDYWQILESENCAVPLTIHCAHETDSLFAQSLTQSVTFWAVQIPCFPYSVPLMWWCFNALLECFPLSIFFFNF